MKRRLVLTREELRKSLDLGEDGVFVWKVPSLFETLC